MPITGSTFQKGDARMSTEKTQFKIVSGPNKEMLIKAFQSAYSENPIEIGFSIKEKDSNSTYVPMQVRRVRIQGINYIGNSDKKIEFYGKCISNINNQHYESYEFSANYSFSNRKGSITFFR